MQRFQPAALSRFLPMLWPCSGVSPHLPLLRSALTRALFEVCVGSPAAQAAWQGAGDTVLAGPAGARPRYPGQPVARGAAGARSPPRGFHCSLHCTGRGGAGEGGGGEGGGGAGQSGGGEGGGGGQGRPDCGPHQGRDRAAPGDQAAGGSGGGGGSSGGSSGGGGTDDGEGTTAIAFAGFVAAVAAATAARSVPAFSFTASATSFAPPIARSTAAPSAGAKTCAVPPLPSAAAAAGATLPTSFGTPYAT